MPDPPSSIAMDTINPEPARAHLGDVTLSYSQRGQGEPVLLIHAGVLADWFQPLLDEPALTSRFRLIRYQRVNYGQSSHLHGPVSVADQAQHASLLLRHLGVERAHVVGHSAGAAIALQLALDHPNLVQTLTVMDAAISDGVPPEQSVRNADPPKGPPFMQAALDALNAGQPDVAVDTFMRNVCGPGYRAIV